MDLPISKGNRANGIKKYIKILNCVKLIGISLHNQDCSFNFALSRGRKPLMVPLSKTDSI